MTRVISPFPAVSRPTLGSLGPGVLAVLLVPVWAVILPMLRPLLPVDETRYLTVAWEMHVSHSYLVPHLNGAIYGHKPPLLFWLINLLWSVTGVSEPVARLVGPMFGALAVGLTWRLGRVMFPDRPGHGAMAALILATTGVFGLFGSMTMFDTMLTCAVLLGVIALVGLDRQGGWRWVWLLAAALAFGVLAKGPVILVHLAPLSLLRPLWGVGPMTHRQWYARLVVAPLLALAMLSVWLVPALALGGEEYRAEVLWRQSAGRMVQAFDHARPVWFFVALLPGLVWPWAWRRGLVGGLRTGLQDRRGRLLAVWVVSVVLLFSLISGKQIHYMLPVLPAFALAIAAMPMPKPGVWPGVLAAVVVVPVLGWVLATTPLGPWQMTVMAGVTIGLVVLVGLAGRAFPLAGWAMAAPATLVAVHVAMHPIMLQEYDTKHFSHALWGHFPAGIGITGYRYQGEFGFAARLTAPVETVPEEAADDWIAAHPGGLLIVGDRAGLDGLPGAKLRYNGHALTLHRIP